MAARMWILIFSGTPAGDPKHPHTTLYIEHKTDGENKGTNFQLIGRHPVFRLEYREGYNPAAMAHLRSKVLVGHMPGAATKIESRSVFSETRIKNTFEDADWGCRNWVGDVLQRMVRRGWVTAEQRDTALDKMIDLCLDIEDEDH